jgi:hypothetical protein
MPDALLKCPLGLSIRQGEQADTPGVGGYKTLTADSAMQDLVISWAADIFGIGQGDESKAERARVFH